MISTFYPAFYIPLWFNMGLLFCGIVLVISSIYFLIKEVYPWFVNLPLLAYGVHFSIFYSFITHAQLTGHILNNETMTLWSAILRANGIFTALVMLFILYITYGGKKCNEQRSHP